MSEHQLDPNDPEAQRLLLAVVAALTAAAALYANDHLLHDPYHTSSLSGQKWVEELIMGHPGRFKDQFGMNKVAFFKLLEKLVQKTPLKDSRHVNVEEQLAIFLYACTTNLSSKKLAERFQRSTQTISK